MNKDPFITTELNTAPAVLSPVIGVEVPRQVGNKRETVRLALDAVFRDRPTYFKPRAPTPEHPTSY